VLKRSHQNHLQQLPQPSEPHRSGVTTMIYERRLAVGEIRLLVISPGHGEIECKLETCLLPNAPKFYALSYTWGDGSKPETITLDGHKMAVTKSAYYALKDIRERFYKDSIFLLLRHMIGALGMSEDDLRKRLGSGLAPLHLWIDALCINQDDLQERNEQVPLMGRIYSKAETVLIHLGEPDPEPVDLTAAVAASQEVSKGHMSPIERCVVHLPTFSHILRKPWFTRLWVLQEGALARDGCAHVMYADQYCSMESLLDITELVVTASRSNLDLFKAMQDIKMEIVCLLGLYTARASTRRPMALRTLRPSTLIEMMVQARGRRCKDPRDHVYGVLGLLAEGTGKAVGVDYAKPVREVFVDAMRVALLEPLRSHKADSGMAIQVWLDSHTEQKARFAFPGGNPWNLPSWVPDWSFDSPGNMSEFYIDLYAAGGQETLLVDWKTVDEDGTKLPLQGFRIGTVRQVKAVRSGRHAYLDRKIHLYEPAFQDAIATEAALQQQGGGFSLYGNREEFQWAYYRTCCADVVLCKDPESQRETGGKRIQPSDRGELEIVFAGMGQANALPREPMPNLHTLQEDAFLILSSGHVAMGRESAQPGDLVVVFPGLPMPLVLRPRPNGSTYEMKGPAYVHAIMDGEALQGLKDGTYKSEWFVID
jgi:hypothetical protein